MWIATAGLDEESGAQMSDSYTAKIISHLNTFCLREAACQSRGVRCEAVIDGDLYVLFETACLSQINHYVWWKVQGVL